MKLSVIVIVLVIVVAGVGFFAFRGGDEAQAPVIDSIESEVDRDVLGTLDGVTIEGSNVEGVTVTPLPFEDAEVIDEDVIVVLGSDGFSPEIVIVEKGDMVIFKNNTEGEMWPASAVHPTHKEYPGSDIDKCFDGSDKVFFDACDRIAPGGTWSFTFNEVGSWKYHDHLNSGLRGTVVVE